MVVGEVLAREGAIPALGFVEDRDMRFDPLLMDQPIQHLGRAVCSVADQLGRIEIEVFERTLDHTPCRCGFGLPDGRCCLDINDDRILRVDQVVGRIGEERRSAVCSGSPRRRVGRCDELRRHLGCAAERGVIDDGEIFLDRAACCIRRQTRSTLDTDAVAHVGCNQTGIDGKAFAADQAFGDAAPQHGLKQPAQQVAVAETAMTVLRECRMIGHFSVELEPTNQR